MAPGGGSRRLAGMEHFVDTPTGRLAAIGALAGARLMLRGESGTRVLGAGARKAAPLDPASRLEGTR